MHRHMLCNVCVCCVHMILLGGGCLGRGRATVGPQRESVHRQVGCPPQRAARHLRVGAAAVVPSPRHPLHAERTPLIGHGRPLPHRRGTCVRHVLAMCLPCVCHVLGHALATFLAAKRHSVVLPRVGRVLDEDARAGTRQKGKEVCTARRDCLLLVATMTSSFSVRTLPHYCAILWLEHFY